MSKVWLLIAALLAGCAPQIDPAKPTIEVWKSATCNCCSKWIQHLRDNGFNTVVHNEENLSARKQALGVPASLRSCHTGVVSGYVVEGHVPAQDIKRLLAEKPAVKGIAVGGMPTGSPGIEMGDQKEPYEVMAFGAGTEVQVYAKH